MDGFADMTDEQLVQTCARLESRGQMQLTLLSNLEEERSALQAQRDLLERRIFEVQEEARTAAMARPERFQPNVPTLRAPERLQLKLHDAAIELTWFWQPWQPGQPAWPLRSVRFEVQQLSDGVGGRLRVRTFQCEASGQVEQRCLIDSWTRGKAYAFQARACAEVGDASEPKELWTSISSIFSEPVNLPAESPGLYSRDSLVTSSPPREVRAEAYASHTFHKSEQQTVSPPFNPAAATATAKAQEEACRREAAETALEKIKAELDEERRSCHELLAQPTAKAQEEASRREAAETALEKIKAELDEERRSYHELLAQPTAKAQEEASRREAAETALEKIKAELDEERWSYHELLAQPTAKAQEEACRREAAETALEKIKAELDEERRSYHELLAQPTAKAQEEASRREAAETALEKIKADLDQERRSYHELWVRHEEQGCEILALKEEVQEWRAELKEAKNMDSQHTGEFDEWKQQAQLEQEELRRRLQNSEETIRRAAEKESEQAKLLETNGRLRIELERWKSEEQQCREQLEKVKIEKEVADRTIQSLQESSQERVQELQRLERPPISSTPFSPAPMDGVSSADRWVTSRREPQPRQSEGHQMVSLQTAHLVPTNPHQRDPRGIAVGEMCGSAPDVLGPTVVQLPRHHLGAVPAVPAVHDMSRMERPAGPPVAPLPGTQLPVAHFSQPVGQLPHLPVGHLPGPCISPPLSCSHSFTPSDSAGYSDDLPPPPRSAPSRALESSNAAVTGRAGSGSFVLSLLASENRWELFHFGDGRGTLEQQALDFLKEKRLKAALAPGLASKMRSMINAGLTRSSVDIVDLI